jgi:isopentenyl diphosphate isomerase/L-lactate dehydrogenase-like FMN-dependent dehydrogenase
MEAKRMETVPINVFEYEPLARAKMDPAHWDYYAGGADDEVTMHACRDDYNRIRLRPRVLVDVSACDTSTTVLSTPVAMPILVAPTAFHGLAHPDGECATAQGAGAAGTLMLASTASNRSLEEIAQAATGPLWFQLYIYPSLEYAASLVHQAEAAGYKAIVMTVDMPVGGNRESWSRHNITLPPPGMVEANFVGVSRSDGRWVTHTWETVAWLRNQTSLPILVKGILTAEDALLALAHGVSGIVISNHGGRQLDGSVTSIQALPEIVAAVAGRCEVFIDGGIRRGTDVLKALALGARAVLVGRPVLWGLATNGSHGVQHILEILTREFKIAMQLTGCPAISSIEPNLVKSM